VRLGRGTDNEVPLPDIRVGLHAASLTERASGLFIERAGEESLRVNGASEASGAALHIGDKVHIGPYEIVVVEPSPDSHADAAITVELTQPLGDALERLMAHSRMNLAQAGMMSRRVWSWALFLVFAIFGLFVPMVVYPFGHVVSSSKEVPPVRMVNFVNMSWNAGAISNPHRFFAQDCATCHRSAFTSVADSACLSCHTNIGSHFEAAADLGSARTDLAATRCAECHEEHRGARNLVIRAEALCVDCHGALDKSAPNAGIRNVGGYPGGHPQFRATVVADAAKPLLARVELGTNPPPEDHSNLKFSHAAHLVEKGFLTPNGQKIMGCADCHVLEPSGQGFRPISFEGQCHSCHDLKFDADLPWREVPHGDAAAVKNAVMDFYARMALEGGVQDPDAPALVRRAVGTPVPAPEPTPTERRDALAWAAQRTNDAMGIIFDDKRGCAYCHTVGRADGNFTVAAVMMRDRFLPEAKFDHGKHRALDCGDCHDAKHSEKSSDVLVPGIENCVACHGPERASLKTQSTCTSCHVFHRQEFGPMKTASAVK
jgi:predicted CXXCH cytochrome family protein